MKTKTSLAIKINRFFGRFWLTSRLSGICLISISLLFTTALELNADGDAPRRVVLYVASGTFGNQGTLYTIDPTTGAVLTTVGLLHDSANHPYGLTGLRYHPTTGIFYAATSGQSPTNPAYLAIVDPATALVTPIGPFGDRSLTDLAIDPTTGIMYGISGFDQKFYTINTSTGQAVQTGSTGIGFANGGGFASTKIGASGFVCGFSNLSFYSFNKTTGAATLIGGTGLRNLVKAADFNPNNATLRAGRRRRGRQHTLSVAGHVQPYYRHVYPGGANHRQRSRRDRLYSSNEVDTTPHTSAPRGIDRYFDAFSVDSLYAVNLPCETKPPAFATKR